MDSKTVFSEASKIAKQLDIKERKISILQWTEFSSEKLPAHLTARVQQQFRHDRQARGTSDTEIAFPAQKFGDL